MGDRPVSIRHVDVHSVACRATTSRPPSVPARGLEPRSAGSKPAVAAVGLRGSGPSARIERAFLRSERSGLPLADKGSKGAAERVACGELLSGVHPLGPVPLKPGRLLSLSRWVVSRARGAPLRVVGPAGVEPAASRLSSGCSSRRELRPYGQGDTVRTCGLRVPNAALRQPSSTLISSCPRTGSNGLLPRFRRALSHLSFEGASPGMAPGLHRRLFGFQRTGGATSVRGSRGSRTLNLALKRRLLLAS